MGEESGCGTASGGRRRGYAAVPGLALVWLALAGCAAAPTRIDGDSTSGFAVYRSGRLSRAELAGLCAAGIEELVVLSGTAVDRECAWRNEACPGLRIRYDVEQDPDVPLDEGFLGAFDRWVEESREKGRKIAFRCQHGWHRAGRLAAWYRIHYQGWSAPAANREMLDLGRMMWLHPDLESQVAGFERYDRGEPCPGASSSCVLPAPGGGEALVFPDDVCSGN